MPESFWGSAIFSVVPSLVVGLIFWFVVRALVRPDRNERQAYAAIEKKNASGPRSDVATWRRGDVPESPDGP